MHYALRTKHFLSCAHFILTAAHRWVLTSLLSPTLNLRLPQELLSPLRSGFPQGDCGHCSFQGRCDLLVQTAAPLDSSTDPSSVLLPLVLPEALSPEAVRPGPGALRTWV